MKKIYSFLALACIGYSAFAQKTKPAGTLAPPTFSTCTPSVLIAGGDATQHVFGTDSKYPSLTSVAQIFEFASTDTVNVVGVLVWIADLKVNGTPGTVVFNILDYTGIGTTGEGTPSIAMGAGVSKSTNDLKASTCLDNANVIFFNTPIEVTTNNTSYDKYAVTVDFEKIGDDVLGLYSTDRNQGGRASDNIPLSWVYQNNVGNPFPWTLVLESTGGYINADILIFPIIDKTAFGVKPSTGVCATGGNPNSVSEESTFFNGMKLSQTHPNPSNDKCLVNYEIETNSKVVLSVYDMQGKRVKFFDEGVQAAGIHSINMDVTDLESGNYIYSLSSDGKLLTKKMSLIK